MKLVVDNSGISHWNNIHVFSDPTLGLAVTVAAVTKHWEPTAERVSPTATDPTRLFHEGFEFWHEKVNLESKFTSCSKKSAFNCPFDQ